MSSKKKSSKKKGIQNNVVSEETIKKEDNLLEEKNSKVKENKDNKESKVEIKKEENKENLSNDNNDIDSKNNDNEVKKKKKIIIKKKASVNETDKADDSNKKTNEDKSKEVKEIKENKKKSKENKEESKKDEVIQEKEKQNKVEQDKKEDKPAYVIEMLKKKKVKVILIILIIILLLLIGFFSVIFSLLNINNDRIIEGIVIKNVDVYNLTQPEAEKIVSEALKKELNVPINLEYGEDFTTVIKAEEIEFNYDVKSAVLEACNVGRTNSLVKDNYTILFTSLFGKNIGINYTYNDELLTNIVDDINSKIPGLVVEPSYYIEGDKVIVSNGKDGIQVRKEQLKEDIINKILDRVYFDITDDSYEEKLEIPVEDAKASKIDFAKMYNEFYCEPKDAYFETEPYNIYKDVDGIDLAISIEEAQKQIDAEFKEEYTFPLIISKANITIKDLGAEAFPYLISTATTKYDASNTNRSTNLVIAASKINGIVLMPGEEFSFNKIVGKRTVEEGYKDAKIYADGGVVDGLAGGICQISSTLYNAVLLANLEITERRNHSYPTSYLPIGKDATVVWGTTDFRFINTRTYPIKIEASVSNGIAEFKIRGISEEKEYETRILPVTTGTIPPTTQFVYDPNLPTGITAPLRGGTMGYKVTTYKEVRYNGEVISKDVISNDTYLPMHGIVRIGP